MITEAFGFVTNVQVLKYCKYESFTELKFDESAEKSVWWKEIRKLCPQPWVQF